MNNNQTVNFDGIANKKKFVVLPTDIFLNYQKQLCASGKFNAKAFPQQRSWVPNLTKSLALSYAMKCAFNSRTLMNLTKALFAC